VHEFPELNSYRLWSLMELLRVYAEEYIEIGEVLQELSGCFYAASINPDMPITDEEREHLKQFLNRLRGHCNKINLVVAVPLFIQSN
jgi:hypothetical protein